MNRGIFTYLRTSALLRALSALMFVVLTGSSAAAGVCSSCSIVQSTSTSQSATCPMSSANDATSAKHVTCCCAHGDNNKIAKQAPMPCCSKAAGDVAFSKSAQADHNAIHPSADAGIPAVQSQVKQTDYRQAAASTFAWATSCKSFGHCPKQMRTGSHTSSPPPPRNFEQERQDNLTTLIQQPHILHILACFTAPESEASSVLSGEPPILSGIGSQLLLC